MSSSPVVQAAAAEREDPLTDSRRELQDNELLTRGPQRQLKGPLQFTLVPSTPAEEPVETSAEAPLDVQPEAVAAIDGGGDLDQGDGSGEITVGPEDPSAQLVKSPVLRRGQKNGDVEIEASPRSRFPARRRSVSIPPTACSTSRRLAQ